MNLRHRIAIGVYASYLSSKTTFPSKVSRVVPENVAISPACGGSYIVYVLGKVNWIMLFQDFH